MHSLKIRKVGSKWVVYSEEGKHLGEYATKAEAEKRLQQVEYFKHQHRLSVLLPDSPPKEFRLFKMGWNETEKGSFLFDDEAAKAVMQSRAEWGVDVMIDLEHQSIEAPPGAADPTARDARGWGKLELRADGLYCVGVNWTADGSQRLVDKRQRYVSPVFESDPETNRVLKIVNVAITALPATHGTPALVAASIRANRKGADDKWSETFLKVNV